MEQTKKTLHRKSTLKTCVLSSLTFSHSMDRVQEQENGAGGLLVEPAGNQTVFTVFRCWSTSPVRDLFFVCTKQTRPRTKSPERCPSSILFAPLHDVIQVVGWPWGDTSGL